MSKVSSAYVCSMGSKEFNITPNGDIYPCDTARSIQSLKIGNIKTTNFREIIINTIELRTLTQEFQPLCDTCAYNCFCGNCPVVTYAKYNCFIEKTPLDFNCYVNKYILDYILL